MCVLFSALLQFFVFTFTLFLSYLKQIAPFAMHSRSSSCVALQGCFCQIFTGGSEFRLAMTDRATIAGIEVARLVSGIVLHKYTGLTRKWNRGWGLLGKLESTPQRFCKTFWGVNYLLRGVKPPDPPSNTALLHYRNYECFLHARILFSGTTFCTLCLSTEFFCHSVCVIRYAHVTLVSRK